MKDALFWSVVLDTVVAIKNIFYQDCSLTFQYYRPAGWETCGVITHTREQYFFITPVPFEILKLNLSPVNKITLRTFWRQNSTMKLLRIGQNLHSNSFALEKNFLILQARDILGT